MLRLDIEKFLSTLGQIQQLTIYKEHPRGIVRVKFKEAISAEKCVHLLNGKKYNGRKVECFYYDGKTNYNRVEPVPSEDKINDFIEEILEKELKGSK